jgi:hypothetical protein
VTGANVIDIWPDLESAPAEDLRGHEVDDDFVEEVYRGATGRLDHRQLMTKTKNVCRPIMVDLQHEVVNGHHLHRPKWRRGV